jgi:hypothetical protein
MNQELENWKELGESSHDIIQVITQHLLGVTKENREEP